MTRPALRSVIALAVVGAALLGGTMFLARDAPARHLRLVNNTEFILEIDVTGARRDGWVPLTVLGRESSTDIRDVADQGDVWVFRFSSAGVSGGTTEVTRAELAQANWRIAIPPSVVERLRRAGVPAAPTR